MCLRRMSRNLGLSWPVGSRYRNQLPTRQLSHSLYLTGVYTKHVASTDTNLSNKFSRTILSGGLSLQSVRRNEREITGECNPYLPNTTKNMTTIFFSFTVNTAQLSTILKPTVNCMHHLIRHLKLWTLLSPCLYFVRFLAQMSIKFHRLISAKH